MLPLEHRDIRVHVNRAHVVPRPAAEKSAEAVRSQSPTIGQQQQQQQQIALDDALRGGPHPEDAYPRVGPSAVRGR